MKTTPTAEKTETKQVVCVCFFLVLAVLAVFGQTAHFEFLNYDDQLYVSQNPVVQEGVSAQAFVWAFTHAQVANWIPLTTLSHMLDCQVFGLHAGGHHLVNVMLHAANAVLLFLVLRRMTGSLWRSAFVAAVFAVHPLRAESVAWVSERKDVLSGFFFLLAIGVYVRYAEKCKMENVHHVERGKKCKIYYALTLVFFVLGLMAKSMVATLPFVLLLLDYWPLGRMRGIQNSEFRIQNSESAGARSQSLPFWGLVKEKIPLFVISAISCVATARVPGLIVPFQIPILERIGNAVVSYLVYLRQAVFPVELAAHYPNAPSGQPIGTVCMALVLLAAITAGVVAWRKKHPCLLMGWLWYLGMLFPVIGIIQISSDAAHADRYTYLPEIGLAVAVTWAVGDWSAGWKHRRAVLGGLMAAVIAVLAAWGRNQTSCWRNDEALWSRALACTSDTQGNDFNSVAHNGLGNALAKKGRKDDAIAQYRKALEINPAYKVAHMNLGIALFDEGEKEAAIAQYQAALNLDPDYAEARYNLGVDLSAEGRKAEAIVQYHKALEINPDYTEAGYNMGNALLQIGNVEEAIAEYRKILQITPEDARILNNLGIALSIKGEQESAMAQFRKALSAKPDFVDAHYDLGAALVKIGKPDEAISHFRKALEINPNYVKARFGLGKALLRKGDFDTAMSCFQESTALGPDSLTRWRNLGEVLLKNQDFEEAIVCFRQGLEIAPHSVEVLADLGTALAQQGETREAIGSWQKALEIKPDQVSVLNNLEWLLSTTPDASLRDGSKAVALAEQAKKLTGGSNTAVLHALAAAYAETGRFGDATAEARRALDLATAQKNTDLAARLQKEIKLYEADTPLRDTVW